MHLSYLTVRLDLFYYLQERDFFHWDFRIEGKTRVCVRKWLMFGHTFSVSPANKYVFVYFCGFSDSLEPDEDACEIL